METKHIILFLSFLLIFSIVANADTGSYWNYLTQPQGDQRYCMLYGNCIVSNLSVIGGYFNVSVTTVNYNVTGIMTLIGDIIPSPSLTHDLGSGASRWRYLYVANVSADDIEVSGDVTADNFYGSGASLTNVNITGVTILNTTVVTENFTVNDVTNTYSVILSGTTIYSNTLFAPLLQLGGNSIAAGSYSVAIGLGAEADSTSSIAMGSGAHSNGAEGVAIGGSSTAGYRAIGLGYWSWATGEYSTASGYATASSGDYSTALGSQSKASGDYSLAMGSISDANGKYSTAIGQNIEVNGTNSYGFGKSGSSTDNNTFNLHNLNMIVDGNVTADNFFGDGSGLTNIPSSAITEVDPVFEASKIQYTEDDMILYYPFIINNSDDYSGNENDGNVLTPVWSSTGGYDKNGNYEFDGDDDYIATTTSINSLINASISFWFKPETGQESNVGGLFISLNGHASRNRMFVYAAGTINTQMYITGVQSNFGTTETVNFNEWNHVVYTYDGIDEKIYVNNVVKTNNNPGVLTSGVANFVIGRGQSDNYRFNGSMDDVKIYNKSLSSSEVSDIYQTHIYSLDTNEIHLGDNEKSYHGDADDYEEYYDGNDMIHNHAVGSGWDNFTGGSGIATPSIQVKDGYAIIDKDKGIIGDGFNTGRNYIWALSSAYPDRGISYVVGSPDYIHIHPESTATSSGLIVSDDKTVSVGATSDGASKLYVYNAGSFDETSYGQRIYKTNTATLTADRYQFGEKSEVRWTGDQNGFRIYQYAFNGDMRVYSPAFYSVGFQGGVNLLHADADVTYAKGLYGDVATGAAGASVHTGYAVDSRIYAKADTSFINGVLFHGISSGTGGTITNGYGLNIDFNVNKPITAWGVYIDNEDKNYFSGDLGIGTKTPSHKLHVVGDVNITGSIHNSLTHARGLSTVIGTVAQIDTWYNITMNASLINAIGITAQDDNRTIVILKDGHYTITYGLGIQDASPLPTASVGARWTVNDVEIVGSYIETTTTKQNADQWLEHTTHTVLNAGDLVRMQYIASDTDVTIQQADTYALQPFNAYGYIQEVII